MTQPVLRVHEFTKLPKEVRDNIYGHVLEIPEHVYLTFGWNPSDRGALRERSQYRTSKDSWIIHNIFHIQIFRTCQLLHQDGKTFLQKFIQRTIMLWKAGQDLHYEGIPVPDLFSKEFGPYIRKLDLVGIPRYFERDMCLKCYRGCSSHRQDEFAVLNRMPNLEVLTIIAPYDLTWDTDAFQFDDDLKSWVGDREDVDRLLLAREKTLRRNYCKTMSYKHFYDVLERREMSGRTFAIQMIMRQLITSTQTRFNRIIDINLVNRICSCCKPHANHDHAENQVRS